MIEGPSGLGALLGSISKLLDNSKESYRYLNFYQSFLQDNVSLAESLIESGKYDSYIGNRDIIENLEEHKSLIMSMGKASLAVENNLKNIFSKIKGNTFFNNDAPYFKHFRELEKVENNINTVKSYLASFDYPEHAVKRLSYLQKERRYYTYAIMKSFNENFLNLFKDSGEAKKFEPEYRREIIIGIEQVIMYFEEKVQEYEEITGKKM